MNVFISLQAAYSWTYAFPIKEVCWSLVEAYLEISCQSRKFSLYIYFLLSPITT